jgi:RND family efflux transporter MFP subunit
MRTFSGVAEAGVESGLSFRVAGTVRRLAVAVGDSVAAGDLIAELDPVDYQLQVQDAEAALRRAQAESRNADASYERVRALYESNNASLSDLDVARTAAEASAEAVASAQNRLELARRQLRFTRLRAPQGGAIASVSVEVNENVGSGKVVAVLTSGSELEVQVAVPGVVIADVREGSPVSVTFDAVPGRTFDARITEVGVTATRLGTTFPVRVRLTEADPAVRAGMAAEVAFRFAATAGRDLFVVPPVAVGEDRSGRFVFVVEPSDSGLGVVHRRAVTVGELTGDGLEILSGLSDGDRVVTAGVTRIQDGLRVRLRT